MLCKVNKNIFFDGRLVLKGDKIDVPENIYRASVKGTLTLLEQPTVDVKVGEENVEDKFLPVTALIERALAGDNPFINTLNRELLNEYAESLGVKIVDKKSDLFNAVVKAVKEKNGDNT